MVDGVWASKVMVGLPISRGTRLVYSGIFRRSSDALGPANNAVLAAMRARLASRSALRSATSCSGSTAQNFRFSSMPTETRWFVASATILMDFSRIKRRDSAAVGSCRSDVFMILW